MDAPAEDRKQVRICNSELVAQQIFLIAKRFFNVSKTFGQVVAEVGFRVVGCLGGKDGGEGLVELGVDETQPFLHPVTLKSPRRRSELSRWIDIRDIRQNGNILGQHLPIIELQRRHITLRVDGEEIDTVDALRALIHLRQLELDIGSQLSVNVLFLRNMHHLEILKVNYFVLDQPLTIEDPPCIATLKSIDTIFVI